MDLLVTKNIILDFYDPKNVSVQVKQNDLSSRFILITCYSQGDLFPLDPSEHSAFIRYRKADETSAFNMCEITDDGKILVELTPQMLAVEGNSYADVMITSTGSAVKINGVSAVSSEGYLIQTAEDAVLSTMNFGVHVIANPFDCDCGCGIESSDEYNALNDLVTKAQKEYDWVVEESRKNLDTIEEYAERAEAAEADAQASKDAAKDSETQAAASAAAAAQSEQEAKDAKDVATEQAENASASASDALQSQNEAASSAEKAKSSEVASDESEANAKNWADLSQSYAVGTDNTVRENDMTDCSEFYYNQSKLEHEAATQEADRAASYSKLIAPDFWVDPYDMVLYMKNGKGVEFIVTEDLELCWKILE